MNFKKSIDFQIGFSDSQIVSFESKNDDVLVFLKAWNEKILKLEFFDSICFFIINSWNISDICQVDNTPSLEKVVKMVYEKVPLNHPYKVFQFIDNDDNIIAEVCCKKLSISIESK